MLSAVLRVTQCVVAVVKNQVELVGMDEGVTRLNVLLVVDELNNEPPEASNKVGYHEHDDNKSEYFV